MSHDRNYEKDGIEISTRSLFSESILDKYKRFVDLAAERIDLQDELDDLLVKRNKVDAARWEEPSAEPEYAYLSNLVEVQLQKVEDNWKQFKPLLDELYEKRKPNAKDTQGNDPTGDVRGAPV